MASLLAIIAPLSGVSSATALTRKMAAARRAVRYSAAVDCLEAAGSWLNMAANRVIGEVLPTAVANSSLTAGDPSSHGADLRPVYPVPGGRIVLNVRLYASA